MKTKAILLISALMFIFGHTPAQSVEKENNMSAEEFAELLGFSWWDIEIPALSKNVHYGVCYEFEKDNIEPAAVWMTLSNEAPQKIRIYIRSHPSMKDYFEIIMIKNGGAQQRMIKNRFDGFAPNLSGKTVSLGEPLVSQILTPENMPENYTPDYSPPALFFKTDIKIN